jgi:RNA polymerase sigma-70 factor (ECF subfamily)
MTNPILYIEDEEDYQILVKRILARAGLEVMVAETGAEGMKMLQRERPSLLILDINLPDTDGYTLCRVLRQDPAWIDLPILMLTVRRRPEEWLRGFASGANDYISKPLNPPEVVERVVNCLEARAHSSTGHETAEFHLVQSAVKGNRGAFEILIEKYRERLMESLRFAIHNDAQLDDVIAHAFATAFEKLREFRGEASFYTWVYRIAVNESISPYRRAGSVSLEELSDGEESYLLSHLKYEKPIEKTIADKEIQQKALEALEQVPPPYREVLELFFLQDLSYHAIAKKLSIPQGTVMSRLHKARRLLQDAWKVREDKVAIEV